MKALSTIKKEFLIEVTTQLVAKERAVTADLIRHLREIERRGLHLEMGYGSMFELLTKRFSYSEGAADRRISAMRLARDVPGVMEAIESGRLSLSAASQAQHFFKNESKRGKAYTPAERGAVTETLAGKSRRECEKELVKLAPESAIPKERSRQITETKTEIRFVASAELSEKLEKLKALLSHHGELGYAELIDKLAEMALAKLDPASKPARATKPSDQVRPNPTPPDPITPAITPPAVFGNHRPAVKSADRRFVWARAKSQCEYVHRESQRRCNSKWALQLDHVQPLALGGAHSLENFRLLCRTHNLWSARRAGLGTGFGWSADRGTARIQDPS